MIKFLKGDFFDFEADIMVNTVNCVGVMGAGIALAFKKKYPKMFSHYAAQCKNKELKPGVPTVWTADDFFSKTPQIINFPTKNHWRKPSEYKYIEDGLNWLKHYLSDKDGITVTLPALGCGHGGLDWQIVKSKIEEILGTTPADVYVFEPTSKKTISKNKEITIEQAENLASVSINRIANNSAAFPVRLVQYTKNELYSLNFVAKHYHFDIGIIASSKPDDIEKSIINEILDFCRSKQLNVIFGGSAFEKKMSIHCNENGMNTANFIPSGIYDAALKLQGKPTAQFVQLLSIGDPFKGFDRKEYMPSVISRIKMSKNVLFTTKKLDWIAKQKKYICAEYNKHYFINYSDLTAATLEDMNSINATPINKNRTTGEANLTPIKF